MSAIEDSGIPLARISGIKTLSGFRLVVTWAEGARLGRIDEVDLSPMIKGYKVYRPLRENPEKFLTARLIEDGDAVAWDGMEMSADAIESMAEEMMSPQDFSVFLARNKLTQEAAAALLGRSRRQIASYATTGPIPRVIALACYGFEARRQHSMQAAAAALA
jgi:hypothetical protein